MPYEAGSRATLKGSLTLVYKGEFSYKLVCTPPLPKHTEGGDR